MTYQQVRDVVHHIRQAHRQLRDALEQVRSQISDARSELFMNALSREEQGLEAALGRFGAQGQEAILDTWLQYVPNDEMDRVVATIEFTPDLSADEIVMRKARFDEALVNLLERLSEQTSAPRVQEFFTDLRNHSRTHLEQDVWSVREFQSDGDPPEP